MQIVKKRLIHSRGLVGNNIYMSTANSVIKQNQRLVMGAGSAKAVRDFYPNIDKLFGKEIKHLSRFGVKFIKYNEQFIGAFQTKYDWRNPSPLELVIYSTKYLKFIADNRPQHIFHLPFPAINHGGQSVDEILPLLGILPDNVIIYLDK